MCTKFSLQFFRWLLGFRDQPVSQWVLAFIIHRDQRESQYWNLLKSLTIFILWCLYVLLFNPYSCRFKFNRKLDLIAILEMKICFKSFGGLYNKYFATFTLLSTMHEKTRSVIQSRKISELLTVKREQTVQVMTQVSSDRLVNEYIMTETKRSQSIRTFPHVKWHLTRVPTCHNPDRQLLPRVNRTGCASASSRSRQVSTSSRREVFELPYQCYSTKLKVQISWRRRRLGIARTRRLWKRVTCIGRRIGLLGHLGQLCDKTEDVRKLPLNFNV